MARTATADAKLVARGGRDGAGIGQNSGSVQRPGTITIAGGTVEAHSGETGAGSGAGIGGGNGGRSGLIRITGGRVLAYGGSGSLPAGAGIGGGGMASEDSYGRIEISGGTVYACGGSWSEEVFGADIGDGTSYGIAYENNNAVVLTVSTEPADWLTAETVPLLRVRASESLPVSAGELLDPADVAPALDADGAVILILPPPDPATRFYRVELP